MSSLLPVDLVISTMCYAWRIVRIWILCATFVLRNFIYCVLSVVAVSVFVSCVVVCLLYVLLLGGVACILRDI